MTVTRSTKATTLAVVLIMAIIGLSVVVENLLSPPSGRDRGGAATGCDPAMSASGEVLMNRSTGTDPAATLFGVSVPFNRAVEDTAAVADLVGKQPAVVQVFQDWSSPYPADFVSGAVAAGMLPMLSWAPWAGQGTTDPTYRLETITAGAHDAYLHEWAAQVREACHPLLIRFAPEMNGDWSPWSEQANQNRPGDFVPAWRHVHDLFEATGTDNVSWVWSPNVVSADAPSFATLYPGDRYVDWTGLSGYNWGTLNPWNRWQSFDEVFDVSLAALAEVSNKPVMLGEVASTEVGGDKSAWIEDALASLAAHQQIRGFAWFNIDKETDWRIQSSTASAAAFGQGISSGTFLGAATEP